MQQIICNHFNYPNLILNGQFLFHIRGDKGSGHWFQTLALNNCGSRQII